MTDNEIIKALEKCLRNGCHTSECYFFKNECSEHCWQCAIRHALDLIHQKDTEIDILIRKKETLKDEVSELKAEVERLQEENKSFSCMGMLYSEIKAEARKEFAERLKERAVLRCFDPMFGVRIALSEPDIDNLLAEMEREGK